MLAACAAPGFGQPTTMPAASQVAASKAADWEHLFDRAEGWTGGDGAATIPLPGNRTLWLFGDSWIGPVRDGKHIGGSHMINNAVAVSDVMAGGAPPAPDRLRFHWGANDREGKPTAWIVPPAEEAANEKNLRYWPTGGGIVTVDADGRKTLFVFWARIRDSGAEGIWNFEGCGNTVARIDNPQDAIESWRIRQTTLTRMPAPVRRAARRINWGAALLAADAPAGSKTMVYVYGADVTNGFNKKLLLARAPAQTLDRFDTWSFRHGDEWSQNPDDAAAIADNVTDEFTINRIETKDGQRLVLIYSKPILDDHIVARTTTRPEGPWSSPIEIYRCPEPRQDKRLFTYAAKSHPELSRPGELLITYCVNSTDFWHMAAEAWIYQPKFIQIKRF